MSVLRLATRRSPLALIQANYVRSRLGEFGVEAQLVHVETSGDRLHDVALDSLGGQGVFAIEVQRALLEGVADVAVHSAKDLPSTQPEGLVLACVPERRDAADVLVGRSLAGLGPGATVATGSPRRRALLLERRPDLRVVGLRGNMAKRLASAGSGGVDAVVAAAAALERLGEEGRISERLDTTWFVPQVGQGALALETRGEDVAARALLEGLNDPRAMSALVAERAFLRELGSGCTIPAGAYATFDAAVLKLSGVMLAIDGSRSVRATLEGDDPDLLGSTLARRLRDDEGGAALTGWGTTS
ncbi:MAG: hydroxymethylbilane synthase [Acidimicrobiaceae bacterium]|nr:hydroxymethylbilane synthase [Acidimicrobiaceae bacterium]